MRAVHAPIKGVDRVTGLPYEADDPVLLLWIHATLAESLSLVPNRLAAARGLALGRAVGDAILAVRNNDGSGAYVNAPPATNPRSRKLRNPRRDGVRAFSAMSM